ncbi:MAG: ankyrin repeat domain-containing protein, partial [bacterium]|nr:ankyrin repeat domain-containing protein [bacterium]
SNHPQFAATPLIWAVEKRSDILQALIDKGADINRKDGYGRTALHIAIEKQEVESVRILLERRADINIKDNRNRTPTQIAVTRDNIRIIELLLKAGVKDPNALLLSACSRDDIAAIRDILNRYDKKLLSLNDKALQTALVIGAKGGHSEIAEILLRSGVDPDSKSYTNDDTALVIAAKGGCLPIVRALISKGADINARKKRSGADTPLTAALANGDAQTINFILSQSPDIRIQGVEYQTPLMLAVEKGYAGIVKELLARGADPNAKNSTGSTALSLASRKKSTPENEEIIRLLKGETP